MSDPSPSPSPTVFDRRPIAARRLGIMHALASSCVRLGISPNTISIGGMVAAIVAGVLLAMSDASGPIGRGMLVAAAGLIQFRLLCNLIDGLVAVEGNQRTPVGELYNEIPDRVADVAVLVGAGLAVTSLPALGWSAAIVAIFVAYIRAVGKGAGLASDYRGPMAKQQRMAVITLAAVVLAVLPEAWRPVLALPRGLEPIGLMAMALWIVVVGGVATALRRLAAIASALRERPPPAA
jgi:phosphatidylglycerophosphate synthase